LGRKTTNQLIEEVHAIRDAEVIKLKEENSRLKQRYKALLKTLGTKEKEVAEVLALAHTLKGRRKSTHCRVKASGKSQSTAFLICSDWHIEESVDPQTVEGLNEYTLEIARQRLWTGFENTLKLVEMCRSKSTIDTLVFAILGDLITGYIHDELVESNSLSPVQASALVYDYVIEAVEFFRKQGKFKQIIIPCCFGNHGRTTAKPRITTAAANSYEWLVYVMLAKHFVDDPVVHVKVADGYFNTLDVYDWKIRFHHGDGIRYQGGIGGVHIPLNKAIAQWNKAFYADLDVLGHWHTRKSDRWYVLNGSVVGYNPFAIKIKADYEPPQQTFFLVHPEKGRTVECPVFLEDPK